MSVPSDTVTCSKCGLPLVEPASLPLEDQTPCPNCGSLSRSICIMVHEDVVVREMIILKGKEQGKRRPSMEILSGDDLHRKSGKWYKLERVIDREKNRYSENVTDPDSGKIVHHCDEPLSEHKWHGSAKKRGWFRRCLNLLFGRWLSK